MDVNFGNVVTGIGMRSQEKIELCIDAKLVVNGDLADY